MVSGVSTIDICAENADPSEEAEGQLEINGIPY